MSAPLTGDAAAGPHLPAHLYVHVPFCSSKCAYCDFFSIVPEDRSQIDLVFRGIRAEIARWASASLDGLIETVYFGGGTPSLAAGEVAETIALLSSALPVRTNAEITMEANPDSFGRATAETLADAGVTRVSLGVQSFDDRVLRLLGRRHDAREARVSARTVLAAGLELSVDLICGVPGQSSASWRSSLVDVADLRAGHVSVYPLSIEPGTPMAIACNAGILAEPDPDRAADMMLEAEQVLGEAGLERYEVASYARTPQQRSIHNLAYWSGSSYFGIGPASHGMVDGATAQTLGIVEAGSSAARVRYANVASVEEWLSVGALEVEQLSAEEAAREDVMLWLRRTEGVPDALVESAGLTPVMHSLVSDGLVTHESGRWRTTQRGWLLGNEVFSRVWLPDEG